MCLFSDSSCNIRLQSSDVARLGAFRLPSEVQPIILMIFFQWERIVSWNKQNKVRRRENTGAGVRENDRESLSDTAYLLWPWRAQA